MDYGQTLSRVEDYFDRTAADTWARLTSDAPVSRIRATVRAGRDRMRAQMLSRLPEDLSGARVLDAGCGAGQMTAALAERGAQVLAVDISPTLIDVARDRLPEHLAARVQFASGDMLRADLGTFDHVMAMDSLIYYGRDDLVTALQGLTQRTSGRVVFTLPPRTPLLMAMWYAGKLFPKGDRSPTMVPHATTPLGRALEPDVHLNVLGRITSGFYISQALEVTR